MEAEGGADSERDDYGIHLGYGDGDGEGEGEGEGEGVSYDASMVSVEATRGAWATGWVLLWSVLVSVGLLRV